MNNFRQTLFLCLAIAAFVEPLEVIAEPLPAADPESVGMSQSGLDRLSASMRELVDDGKRAGIVWGVVKDGKLVQLEAYGKRDMDADLPMEHDSVFRIYSQSRAVTAVAVLSLVDEGKLSLDDPVSEYVPEVGNMQVIKEIRNDVVTETEAQKTPMTVRHLFTYTSGLGYAFDWPASLGVDQREILSLDGDLSDMMVRLGKLPLLAHPGERWIYGFHSEVLARIAEIISGQPYNEFLRERALDPIDMIDTGFWLQQGSSDRLAQLYAPPNADDLIQLNNSGFLVARDGIDVEEKVTLVARPATPSSTYTYPGTFYSGGGGLVSTVPDYLRFGQMFVEDGALGSARVLAPETVDAMATNMLTDALTKAVGNGYQLNPPALFAGYGWGLSIGVRLPELAHTIPGSPGDLTWGGLANTTFFIDRTKKIVAVAMAQYIGPGADELPFRLREGVYGALDE